MTNKIAIINDLSGFGRCSLVAGISVISAMGVQPCPLPTAILSAQTGYASYFCDDYTDNMEYFRAEWEKMNASFDGICTGFIASEQQVGQIFRFIDTFYQGDAFLLVDPVMGDDGKTYSIYSDALCLQMRKLSQRADIITPNLTELCLLSGVPYEDIIREKDTSSLISAIEQIGKSLIHTGPKKIIVTGIRHMDSEERELIGNLYITAEYSYISSYPCIGGSFSGTGDLFAACVAAGMARRDSLTDTIELAGRFLQLALKDSVDNNVPRNEGVNYEKYMYLLMNKYDLSERK